MTAPQASAGALRLRDAASGELREVGRSRSSLVRIRLVPGAGTQVLRRAVVADLIRRVVELGGGQAVVGAGGPVPDLLSYNVHPADPDAPEGPDDVVVGADSGGAVSVGVGPVSEPDTRVDPLALRLLLLSTPHAAPVVLHPAAAARAGERLSIWRDLVRRTASVPSAPMPTAYQTRLLAMARNDLDIGGVAALVDEISGDPSAEGARFEFLMYADRLLGLDLAAELTG